MLILYKVKEELVKNDLKRNHVKILMTFLNWKTLNFFFLKRIEKFFVFQLITKSYTRMYTEKFLGSICKSNILYSEFVFFSFLINNKRICDL